MRLRYLLYRSPRSYRINKEKSLDYIDKTEEILLLIELNKVINKENILIEVSRPLFYNWIDIYNTVGINYNKKIIYVYSLLDKSGFIL